MKRKTARTKTPGFPSWAPVEVIDRLREERARLDAISRPPPGNFTKGGEYQRSRERQRRKLAESCDLMHRLLTHSDMRRVWDAVQSSQKPCPATFFASFASHGFHGPLSEARLTPAEHRAFLADVQKRCEKLSKLLYGSDLDHRLIARLELPLRPEVGRAYWRCFSEILDSVASGAKYYAAPSAAKRAHGKYARRAYFVRHLTGFFREYLGRPRRDLVVIATATAFPEVAPLDQRHVTRLAP